MFIAKLDSGGSWLWAERAGCSNPDSGNSIAVDPLGNVYVIGDFDDYDSADFGNTTLNSSGGDDVFVAGPSFPDSDGDGVSDNIDAFPNDGNETTDSDQDGVGDNADAFPTDANETADSDGDGVGDNGDSFPSDANETADSDGDGMGDNGDAFPSDANETTDSDGDGVGDNGDAFPNDASKTTESVDDGDKSGESSEQEGAENDEGGLPGFTFALTISVLGIVALFRRSSTS